MKLLCVILDMLAVAFLGVIVRNNGLPYGSEDKLALASAFALVLFNLFALLREGKPSANDGLISLFIKRKILEEKAKIAGLKKVA